MKRPAIDRAFVLATIFLVAGCPGPAKPETTSTGSGGTVLAKRITISWGIEKQGEMTDLFLALMDETGKVASHTLGRWKGDCSVTTPAKAMNALTGMACRAGGSGTELHAVTSGGDTIIVLKMGIDEGVVPDPMGREEVTRIKVPLGVGIDVDPIASTTGAPGVR